MAAKDGCRSQRREASCACSPVARDSHGPTCRWPRTGTGASLSLLSCLAAAVLWCFGAASPDAAGACGAGVALGSTRAAQQRPPLAGAPHAQRERVGSHSMVQAMPSTVLACLQALLGWLLRSAWRVLHADGRCQRSDAPRKPQRRCAAPRWQRHASPAWLLLAVCAAMSQLPVLSQSPPPLSAVAGNCARMTNRWFLNSSTGSLSTGLFADSIGTWNGTASTAGLSFFGNGLGSVFNNGLGFDGLSNGYVSFGTYSFGGAMSFAFWANSAQTNSGDNRLVLDWTGTGNAYLRFSFGGGGGTPFFMVGYSGSPYYVNFGSLHQQERGGTTRSP